MAALAYDPPDSAQEWQPRGSRMWLNNDWKPAVGTGADDDAPQAPTFQDPAKAILFAHQQVGRPYSGPLSQIGGGRFGDPGYDCSSFVSSAFGQLGIQLTPFTDAAAGQTQLIDRAQAQPGDIVFYRYSDASQPGVTYPHMGIYLGDGQMIDAAYSTGVTVRPLLNLPYEIRRAPGVNPSAVVPAAAQSAQVAASEQQPAAAPTANPQNAALAQIHDRAIAAGLGEDDARVAQAIAMTEGGMTGKVGDNGRAHGAFQFNAGGQLPAYAQSLGVTPQEAARRLAADPMSGVDWALNGYLGQAIRRGQQQGLQGADLATYAQRYGQVSESPERSGANYNRLSTNPVHAAQAPAGPVLPHGQYDTGLTASQERGFQEWKQRNAPNDSGEDYDLRGAYLAGLQPAENGHWVDTFKKPNHETFSNESQYAKGTDAAWAGSWQGEQFTPSRLSRDYERQYHEPVYDSSPQEWQGTRDWGESRQGMIRAGQPLTTNDDWQNAGSRYEQEFGAPVDWSQYEEDPDTYEYMQSALGMSRAGDLGEGGDDGPSRDSYANEDHWQPDVPDPYREGPLRLDPDTHQWHVPYPYGPTEREDPPYNGPSMYGPPYLSPEDDLANQEFSRGAAMNDAPVDMYRDYENGPWLIDPVPTWPPLTQPGAPRPNLQEARRSSVGEGGDVGVGAGWWGDDDPFQNLYDMPVIGGLARGIEGIGGLTFGSAPPRETYNDPQQDQQLRSHIQDEYGWQSPGDWAQKKWNDATQGQNPAYEPFMIGGLARAAGLAANVAMDVGNVPYKGLEYLGGALGGAGQYAFDPQRQGATMHHEYGFAGEKEYPTPQSWGDVFDPAQATARFEAAGSPVAQFGIGIGTQELGGQGVGMISRTFKQAQAAEAANSAMRLMDVPLREGYAEDFGRLLSTDVAQTVAKMSPIIGGGLGATLGGPDQDPLQRAEGAAVGTLLGLGGWKLATNGQTVLQKGAREYRIATYGWDAQRGDLDIMQAAKAGDILTDTQQARFEAIQEARSERTALMKQVYTYGNFDDPNAAAQAEQHVKILADEADMAIESALTVPSTSEYPYFHKTIQGLAVAFTDRQAALRDYTDRADQAYRHVFGMGLPSPRNPSELMERLKSVSSEDEQLFNQMAGIHDRAGVGKDPVRAELFNDLFTSSMAMGRAITLPHTAEEFLSTEPDALIRFGLNADFVNDTLAQRARVEDMEARVKNLHAAPHQMRLGTDADFPMTTDVSSDLATEIATPRRNLDFGQIQYEGTEYSSIGAFQQGVVDARKELEMRTTVIQNALNGRLPSDSARIRESLDFAANPHATGAPSWMDQTLPRDKAMLLPTEDPGMLRGFPTTVTMADTMKLKREADEMRKTEGDLAADTWLTEETQKLWDSVTGNGKPVRGDPGIQQTDLFPEDEILRGSRGVEGNPRGFMATGPLDTTPSEAFTNHLANVQRIEQLGPGTAANWMKAVYEIQDNIYTPLLQRARAAGGGLLSQEQLEEAINNHAVYGALRRVGENSDATLERGVMALTEDSPTKRYYSTTDAVKQTFATSLQHIMTLTKSIRENEVTGAMVDLANQKLGGWDNVMVPMMKNVLDDAGRPMLDEAGELVKAFMSPGEAKRELPKGWGVITNVRDGVPQPYRVPEEVQQSLLGMTKGTADKAVQMIGRTSLVNMFRMGVTIASAPFILANTFRDAQDVIQNSGMPGHVLRNYIGSSMDVFAHGVDDFMERNANSLFVQALPQRVRDSVSWLWDKTGDKLAGESTIGDYLRSGGGNTLTTSIQGSRDAMDVLGIRPDGWRGSTLWATIKSAADVLPTLSQISELTARNAVYRAAIKSGQSDIEGAMLANNVTINFDKGGEFFKTMGILMPLVNARIQGTLRSAEAFKDDPQGYIHRLTLGATLPTAALYAYNRSLYSDLYDAVPQSDKDKNFIIGYGSIKDDRDKTGAERLLYVSIPKNEITALVANPLEALLDTVYHVKHGETDLKDFQRTERTAGQLWLAQLANMVPISQNGNTLFDGQAWLAAAIDANPLAGTLVQMAANKDDFIDRPIVDDKDMILPAEFRRGPNGKVAGWSARAISHLANQLHLPGMELAPPEVAFVASHLGGSAATGVLYSMDKVWEAFRNAGFPLDSFQPHSISDLKVPEGIDPMLAQSYMDAMDQVDFRPWQVQIAGRFFKDGMAGVSTATKVSQLSREEQTVWKQTVALENAQKLARDEAKAKIDDIYNDPDTNVSHDDRAKLVDKVRKELNGAIEELNHLTPYDKAIKDPAARDAFQAALPGIPIKADPYRPTTLDPSIPIESLTQRYLNPPGVLADQVSAQTLSQARSQELSKMAAEFNVPQSTLRDYIAAVNLNNKLPAIGVPAVYLDKLVNEYIRPPGDYNHNDVQAMFAARRQVVEEAAAKWGVPKQDLLERVQTRMVNAADTNPLSLSKEHATALFAKIKEMPQFVDAEGNPVGMQEEWAGWQQDIAYWRSRAPGKENQWPFYVRELAQSAARAAVQQQQILMADEPKYYDYQAWYGYGKNLSPQAWNEFMSGQKPRYKDEPDLAESARRDGVIRNYQALPQGAEKNAARNAATRYTKMLVPGWQAAMQLTDLGESLPDYSSIY